MSKQIKMANAKALSVTDQNIYQALLDSIRQEITTTRDKLQRQKALCYWRIGRHIAKHVLNNEGKSGYGERLFPRLSHDLKIDVRTLRHTVEFYRAFPKVSTCSQLSWSHYRELLKIKDPGLRESIFQKVKDRRVTARELQARLNHIKKKKLKTSVTLDISKGTLYTYLTDTRAFTKPAKGRSLIDAGFGILREVPSRGIGDPAPNSVVESQTGKNGFVLVESGRTTDDLYTYRAHLDYVIDGDTVVLYVDLGFHTYSRQKLRLRGINTPEIKTPNGQKAKTFVEEILKRAKVITIRTYRRDKYDRYLADIFVGPKEIFLNQLLLDKKLAAAY